MLAYMKLFRLPNVFTAWADIIMGYLMVSSFSTGSPSLAPVPVFLCLLGASSLIYTAGMVLNDYYDRAIDQAQRPDRPIPSGQISPGGACLLGYLFLALGLLIATVAGYLYPDATAVSWRGGLIALLLCVMVIAYDAVLKRTFLAPLAMGGCRFFNILLGMSLAGRVVESPDFAVLGYDSGQLMVAGGLGLFITGVTWFARTEAVESSRGQLIGGGLVMLLGILVLASVAEIDSPVVQLNELNPLGWYGLIVLLSLANARRVVLAIHKPIPENVQVAVKQALLSLIFYNAAVALAVCGTLWGVVIVALLIPMLGLGRWVYST